MRYVIRDAETEKNMDCFETIRGCVDRIREFQEEDVIAWAKLPSPYKKGE